MMDNEKFMLSWLCLIVGLLIFGAYFNAWENVKEEKAKKLPELAPLIEKSLKEAEDYHRKNDNRVLRSWKVPKEMLRDPKNEKERNAFIKEAWSMDHTYDDEFENFKRMMKR